MHFDITTKLLMQSGARQMLRKVHGHDPGPLRPLDESPQETAAMRRCDFAAYGLLPGGRRGLYLVELQSLWKKDKPLAMALYAGERTLRLRCPILPVMILLTPHAKATDTYTNEYLSFRFRLVKMWEQPTRSFLDPAAPQLWPWAPLTQDGVACVPEFDKLLRHAKVPPERLADTASFFAILLGLRDDQASSEFIHQHRHIMIQSPAYEYIKREGRTEGRIEGRIEGLTQGRSEGRGEGVALALLTLLERRFGPLPAALQKKLRSLRDVKLLNELVLHAAQSSSLGEFRTALRRQAGTPVSS